MKVLVLSYFYPPLLKGGAERFLNLAPWLKQSGWDLHILTTSRYGSLPSDSEQNVTRVKEWFSSAGLSNSYDPQKTKKENPFLEKLLKIIGEWIIPDTRFYKFGLSAMTQAVKLHAQHHYDLLITTSSPESSHIIGALLKRRLGIPWIADFRDGWMFERPAGNFPVVIRSLQAILEKITVKYADAVVSVTKPITDDFVNRLGVLNAHTITNSFKNFLSRGNKSVVYNRPLTMTHIGQLSLSSGSCDIEPFLRAISNLRHKIEGKIRFIFAGRLSNREERLIAEKYRLSSFFDLRGVLTRDECIHLMARADWLLLVTDPVRKSVMTAKIFDYFESGKPIFALAANNAAEEAIRSTYSGVCVASDDTQSIENEILHVLGGGSAINPDKNRLMLYSSEHTANQYAALLNQICSSKKSN